MCTKKLVLQLYFSQKSCNLAENFCLEENLANPNISRIFGSTALIFLKIWLGSLAGRRHDPRLLNTIA